LIPTERYKQETRTYRRNFSTSKTLFYPPNFDCCLNCKWLSQDRTLCTLRDVQITEPEKTHCLNFVPTRGATIWQAFALLRPDGTHSMPENIEQIAIDSYYNLEALFDNIYKFPSTQYIQSLNNELAKKDTILVYQRPVGKNYVWCDIKGDVAKLFGNPKIDYKFQIPSEFGQIYSLTVNSNNLVGIAGQIPQKKRSPIPLRGPVLASNFSIEYNPSSEKKIMRQIQSIKWIWKEYLILKMYDQLLK